MGGLSGGAPGGLPHQQGSAPELFITVLDALQIMTIVMKKDYIAAGSHVYAPFNGSPCTPGPGAGSSVPAMASQAFSCLTEECGN